MHSLCISGYLVLESLNETEVETAKGKEKTNKKTNNTLAFLELQICPQMGISVSSLRRSGRDEVNVNFRGAAGKGLGSPRWRPTRIHLRDGKTKLRGATGQGRAGWQLAAERERACPGEPRGVFERGREPVGGCP